MEMEVSRYIIGDLDSVRDVLRNVADYDQWWPIKTVSSESGSVSLTPVPLISIELRRAYNRKKNVIDFEYVKGPLRGIGRWILTDCEGMDYVRVVFYSSIKGITPGINLFIKLPWFRKTHRKTLKEILARAEQEAREKKEVQNIEETL